MSMVNRLRRNSIIETFVTLTGNARACLYTEPLWGIPYNLYLPFASVYMSQLGMTAMQIGVVSTVFLASQMVFAIFSGVLADKLGRRLCTLIFDVLSWSVPSFLWMLAKDYRWFLVAAVFNGAWRVTENSWNLLLIEDSPDDKLVNMFSITQIAGLIAGFVAPVAYIFVRKYSVVPTVRVLYAITFVMMTTKFIVLYIATKETSIGLRRMAETRGVRVMPRLWDSRKVLLEMLKSPRAMYTVGLLACYTGACNVSNTFWPLLVTQKLGIAAENLSVFSTIKSLLTLLAYFTIVPRLNLRSFKKPLLVGLALLIGQQVLMLVMPAKAYWLVLISVVIEAVALSMLSPLTTSLQMVSIDREERARMLGFFYAICLLVTSPLGSVAGALAQMNRSLPFVLNLVLTLSAVGLSIKIGSMGIETDEAQD